MAAALPAENRRALLLILQGMDAFGKDVAVKKAFTGVSPQLPKPTDDPAIF